MSWLSSVSPAARAAQSFILDRVEPVIALVEEPLSYVQDQYAALQLYRADVDALAALRAENDRLKTWKQVAQMVDAENKALKTLTEMDDSQAVSFQSARIVMDQNSTFAHTVLARLSADHNVTSGQAVLNDKGLIGRVVDVADQYARILLLTDHNARVPVVIETSGDKAILAGQNKDQPVLEHLSPYHMVKVGQKVMTSGDGGVFPYGISIGETAIDQQGDFYVRLYAGRHNTSFVKIVDYGLQDGLSVGAVAGVGLSNVY